MITDMEHVPTQEEPTPDLIRTPVISYEAGNHLYEMHFLNTICKLYEDFDNHIHYWDEDDTDHFIRVPEPIWDRLMCQEDWKDLDERFPFAYFPRKKVEDYLDNPKKFRSAPDFHSKHEYEPMNITLGEDSHHALWTNTSMHIYPEHMYDHVRVIINGEQKLWKCQEKVWQHLFENDYPLIYLPFVEQATKQWMEEK